MTVLEIIQRSAEFLEKRNVESPRLQIELMLAQALDMPRLQLYMNFERVLSDDQVALLRGFVKRRGEREPLQHILGGTNFCGLELMVGPGALIPRPETELLAEAAWKRLADAESPVVLDFGAGTACITLAIAENTPNAQLHALDISPDALEIAQQNIEAHTMSDRVTLHEGDGFAALPDALRFDVIVSNPPYIAPAEIETLEPEVRDFDPRAALDGGPDGLDFYRRLASESGAWLKPGGALMMEFGDGQAPAITEILSTEGWVVESVAKDLNAKERFLIATRRES